LLDCTKAPLSVVYRSPGELKPAPRNARTHSAAQVEQLARSITAFGWTNPILVDERGGIIAGHGRIEAARKLGMAEVPTITLAGLSAEQKRALVLADNQLALNAGWDAETLRLELGELGAAGFDVSLVGMSDAELDQILGDGVDPAGEWQGMPEFAQEDNGAHQTIAVHLATPAAVEAFAALIGQRITNKTRFVWFPQAEKGVYIDKRYATDVSDLHTLKGAFR
jgi:ParB-like chromosome segregation protein Spo0J